MKFRFRRAVLIVMVFLTSLLPAPGQIPLPSPDVRFTVGADEATRRLLENYPHEVHDMVLSIIRDSTPMLLIAADQLLARITKTGDKLLDDVKCAAIGASNGIPIAGLDIDKLIAMETQKLGMLGPDSSPQDYFDTYTKLTETAGRLICVDRGISDTTNVTERMARYSYRSVIWHRLVDSCENADACVESELARTHELFRKSDQRDKDSALLSKGDPLAQVDRPRRPRVLYGFERERDQKAIVMLFGIQQKLWLAKYHREFEAETHMAKAEAEMQNVEAAIEQGERDLAPKVDNVHFNNCPPFVPWPDTQDALQQGARAAQGSVIIEQELSRAVDTDAVNQQKNFETLTSRLNEKKPFIKTMEGAKNWVLFGVCPKAPST
jgi:hypothetical protein